MRFKCLEVLVHFVVRKAGQFGQFGNAAPAGRYTVHQGNIKILWGDYTAALDRLGPGDFAYLDPPYAPVSQTARFTSYTSSGFGISEQVRLANACRDLDRRGVKWLLSNSSVPVIHDLYSNYIIDIVPARRAVNCNANKRGVVDELLIHNFSISNMNYHSII